MNGVVTAPVRPRLVPPPVLEPAAVGADLVRRHALAWFLAANAVGLFLAATLLWPPLGDAFAPLTYGRWMPLHLNWHLYGWCALPLVGVLLAGWLQPGHPQARHHVRLILGLWSGALVLGGLSWLRGTTSGKVFLDWHGWARPLLPVAMVALWTLLAAHVSWGWRRRAAADRILQVILLAALLPVPSLLYAAADRQWYPAVNPHSGGATGSSLLASTLGVVVIFALLPRLLARPRAHRPVPPLLWWGAWGFSVLGWAAMRHGHASHHQWDQILGLALLLAWIPLLIAYGRSFQWAPACRPWLQAAAVWWAALVLTGWLTFLPGVLERVKFTHALVAHAHLAMAGLVTSVNFALLNQLQPRRPLQRGFWWWQAGCAAHVLVLAVAGWCENERGFPGLTNEVAWQAVYGARFLAGGAMVVGAALAWRENGRW